MPRIRKKRLKASIPLMLISLALAIILWIVLSLTAFPEDSKVFHNVPIDFSLSGSAADVRGLSVIQSDIQEVNVSVNGLRYQIGSYTNDDIHVGLNLDSVRESGSYTVPLVVSSVNGDQLNNIVIEPDVVHIDFDRLATKELSVEDGTLTADISSVRPASNHIIDMSEIEIRPSSITISGPQDYIDQVTSAVIKIDGAVSIRESGEYSTEDVKLYSGNSVFDNSRVTIDRDSFSVYIPVYATKSIPLKVVITGYTDQIDLSDVKYTLSTDRITVRGQDSAALERLEEIVLGYVDIRDVTPGYVTSFTIPQSSYYTNVSGVDEVLVSFDLEGYTTRRITLRNNQMHTVNAPAGYSVTIETAKLSVTVVGPEDVLDVLDNSNFIAQIDLLDYGEYIGLRFLTPSVYAPNYPNVWATGLNQVYAQFEPITQNEPEVAE